LEAIGGGAMGEVYRARRPDMRDQRVAIKIPKTSDESSRRRFEREIAASAMLQHENIVRAFDWGEIDGCLFLVMELADGRLLEDVVRQEQPLPCQLVGRVVRDVASGLAHAQRRRVVNRDIKPENILMSPQGQAKILDFGLAIIGDMDGSPDRVTLPGTLLGTVAFMAPEQALSPRDVTVAADVYALGCTAYFALVGQPPFRGKLLHIVEQHAAAPRPDVRATRADVPPAFASLISRMMAIQPEDRPAPEAILAELYAYGSHLPGEAPADAPQHVTEGELIDEDEAVAELAELEPVTGELLDQTVGSADSTVAFQPPRPARPWQPPPEPADDGIPTIPLAERIEEGEAIETLPIDNLVGSVPAASASRTGAKRRTGSRPRTWITPLLVGLAACLLMAATYFGTRPFLGPPDPQVVWDKIQEEYQLHTWKAVEGQLEAFGKQYPNDPHVVEIPFFLAMCKAGRDVFSQTGDLQRGLAAIDQVFFEFRDQPEYEKYAADLFQNLQRLMERLIEQTRKTSQPEALESARKAHELLTTVAKSMPDDWVPREVDKLTQSLRAAEREFEVTTAKQEVVETLQGIADAKSAGEDLDRAYEQAKAVFQRHAELQTDAELTAAFRSAYESEAGRVTYEPFADDAESETSIALDATDETVFVVWDQPSAASQPAQDVSLALADGVLYAFDASGQHLWSHRLGIDAQQMPITLKPSPTSPDAVLAVSTLDNSLLAIASKTGRVLWRYQPGAEQDLSAPLTISLWRPAPNKPPRVRGLLPTASGEVHVLELVRGKRMGRFQTHAPLTVGGAFDPATQLLFFPADSKRVFALDPAVIEAREPSQKAARSVLFTNHLSGALRSPPMIVGQYMLLTELSDLENTHVHAFEIREPLGFPDSDAAPVAERVLPGWSWFTPPLSPDRITVITDAGVLGVLGLNLDNPDEALYPLIHDGSGQCPTLGIDAPYRAMAIHSDEHLLWVMAGGSLRQIALDVLNQKTHTLWPTEDEPPQVVGLPLHEAALDRESERICVATRSADATRTEFVSVDANTGQRLWSRQLGIHAVGDPVVAGNLALLVDRSGRILQLAAAPDNHGTPQLTLITDDLPPEPEPAGDVLRLPDLTGQEYLVLPVSGGGALAVRPISAEVAVPAPWQVLPLPSARLQGRPAVLDRHLIVPCSDGSLQRVSLDGSSPGRSDQTFQWAPASAVAQDDYPSIHPLGPGKILLVLRDSLRWLEYVTVNAIGQWRQYAPETLFEESLVGEPLAMNNLLFVAGAGKSLYRLQLDQPQADPQRWRLEGKITAGPFSAPDTVLVVLDGRRLAALDPDSLEPRWTAPASNGRIRGRPLEIRGTLLVTDDSGWVKRLRLQDGQVLLEIKLPAGAIPSAAGVPFGRRILVPLVDGTLAWQEVHAPAPRPRPGVAP